MLGSKHWLGLTFYHQKYSEAEGPLQQAADGRERKLGSGHKDTLYGKHWLGLTFYHQKKSMRPRGRSNKQRTGGRGHSAETMKTHLQPYACYNNCS
jgi:hypothetical protein